MYKGNILQHNILQQNKWQATDNKRCMFLERKAMKNLGSILKSRDKQHFADKGPYSQSYSFSSSHV